MVLYFANRKMDILGLASTELMEGFTISRDLKTEDTDTGVATFECYIHWTEDTRALAEECTTAGNYLLRSYNNDNEFYTIIETEVDTKDQTIYIYAEDAGMDLLNETVGEYSAPSAMPIADYVEMYAMDTGFEIGINEISNLSRTLSWTGTATAAERIASVATQFDNAEISYTFEIKGLVITHKYINIHKKRGKDVGVQLRLNRDVDRIITTTSVADLATALYVTGGTPEGSEDPITLDGYSYDDGDMYVEDGLLKSREALAVWSRYVWAHEPGQIEGYTGHIVKQWSYDTTSQSELCNRAITQLGKVCEPAVNYEIDIQQLPENVGVGDYVDIVDEKGELYLSSRILKLTTSVCEEQQTATLGEFLIVESGISQTVKELAEQFSQLAKSRQYYIWIVYADDEYGDGISLDPEGKTYMGTCTTSEGPDPDLSDPTRYKWSLIQGENGVGIEEINTYYGKSDSPTDVPTEWQEEPYELLHNEYQWSYTEIIYTNGVIELTSPTIIAYYDYLNVDELEARVAKIEEAYVSYEEVGLLVADDVEAAIVNAGFLTADSALILELTAFSESVYTLLGGEGSFGELQSIYLSSDNAVIDYAVIANAVAGTLMAELITATYIDTDVITIMSEDGGITIIGNQIQITTGQTLYYDENGNLRIQIGQDASGNFSFIIYDEDGEGIMMDSEGIHESAVPDGLIVDSMVSDDAAIQGSKLDIASVAECLNEDGSLILDAAQITINDTTLSAWYTEVSQELEGLAGLTSEGLMNVEPWFCLWDESTPPADEDLMPAICGEAICGLAVCGMTDGTLWVDHDIDIIDGLYKWVKWKGYYADGHTEWGDPYCLTDGYLRQETSVLQTQLEVVQGAITAKVWMTDIEEALDTTITDLWSEINITLDSIQLEVGTMTSTVDSLSTQVADIELTTESITQTVYDIEQTLADIDFNGVTNFTTYFCLWYSATEAPPDDGEITAAICGVAVCGLAICGVTDGTVWHAEEPDNVDGLYKWVRYLLEYEDGHTEWSKPYCLTDDYARSEIKGAYSQIEQLADSISLEVGAIYSDLDDNYATKASLVLKIDEETGEAVMTAEADTINLESNRLIIESEGFSLTRDGYIIINTENFTLTEDGSVYAADAYLTSTYLEGEIVAEGYPFKTVIQGGQIEFYYQNERACYMYSDYGHYLRINDIVRLMVGSSEEQESRYLGVENGNGMIELMVRSDNLGTIGLYDGTYNQFIVAREIENMCTYVGAQASSGITTIIRGSSISISNEVTVSGTVNCAGISTTSGITLTQNNRTLQLLVYSDTNRGLYDNTYSRWLIAVGDDNLTYVGNNSVRTYLRGNGVYVNSGAGITMAAGSSGNYVTLSNDDGTIRIVPCASYSGGYRKGLYDSDSNLYIIQRDGNYQICVGNSTWNTVLYGLNVILASTGEAVTSDRQFKDNITPFEPEVTDELTDKLTPKIYTVKDDPETKHIGFIVDEVEDAMRAAGYDPDEYGLTTSYKDEDGNELGAIRYDEFIPILLYEIQELRDRVNALENPEEGLIDPGIELN